MWCDISERIDVNEINETKECGIYHYWYFSDKRFKFQPDVCNDCHDVLMMSTNLSNIAILNLLSADYCCIIRRISKSVAINMMQNIDLTKKSGTL